MLTGKKIILGVCGGIAAYKAVELLRLLTKAGAEAHIIMTSSATEFVAPLTFQTLSGNPVHTSLFNLIQEQEIGHISLADRADLFVIVPATANVIGKIAAGIADDILTTTVMATKAPVLFAPAMNVNMYTNPIYLDNEQKLRNYGYLFVPPVSGTLACGVEGEGKLASPETIFEAAVAALSKKDLAGKTVLITAGATREEIDPVRFISNHSSGKMGYALAKSACRRGANVYLVTGPTCIAKPCGPLTIQVNSADEMHRQVMALAPQCDLIIKAAAVADYRPAARSVQKIKKGVSGVTLQLVKNRDILAELGMMSERPYLVGFAAETENLKENAAAKLEAKNLDMIVANDVSQCDSGFNVDTNRAHLLFRGGDEYFCELMSKEHLAEYILDQVATRLALRHE